MITGATMFVTKYIMNVLISLDQVINALSFGDPDETVSSRIGKIKRANDGVVPWRYPIAKVLDKVLNDIDNNHCIEAIENDEGKDQLL